MEHSYFFNSIPGDSRVYQASDFAEYFSVLTRNGVYKNNGNLEVTADGQGMTTTLASGSAFLEGYRYENDSSLSLEHSVADPNYDRIDLIVLRLDKSQGSRFIKAFVLQGMPSINPTKPELTHNDYVYEIALAEVRVIAGQSIINQSQITDQRGEILDPITDGTKISQLESNAIVEMGTNSMGTYIRYENGLQICHRLESGGLKVNAATGSLYYGYLELYFPAMFVSPPTLSPLSVRVNGIQWTGTRNVYNDRCEIYLMGTSLDAEGRIGFIAIGRWK